MSPAGRRTSAFYKQRKRQQLVHRIQTATFALFCLLVVTFGIVKAGHQPVSATRSAGVSAHQAGSRALQPGEDAHLKGIIDNWADDYSFDASVSIHELTGAKRTATLDAEHTIVTASTFKLYVAYAVLHGVEQGTYKLATTTGDGNSIQTDLENMILNSDNDSSRTLGFMVGWPGMDRLLASLGISHTNTNNYVGNSTVPVGDKTSTASDFDLFLQKLYAGQLLNSADTRYLIGLLESQNYRSGIPAGVPYGIAVADKPGWLTPADGGNEYVQNDAGIVYGPKSTYIIVVTTTGSSMSPISNLSKQIYNYLEN